MQTYDMVVVGSGPGGEKAAVQAAKLKKSVLVIERGDLPGGSCLHTGTIPSKTLRESVRFISLLRQRAIYGVSTRLDSNLQVDHLMHRKKGAIQSLVDRLESTFERNRVDYLHGEARFVDPHTIEIVRSGENNEMVRGEVIVLATGSRPYRPEFLDFSHPRIKDSDTILGIHKIPGSITIVGAGVIGCEYATIFSNLGCKVNLISPRNELLDFLDEEVSAALAYLMREQGVRLRMGEDVISAEVNDEEEMVHAQTQSGKVLKSEVLLFANGRTGNTDALQLDRIGLTANQRGQLDVNEFLQTEHSHIYAVGDVIGFPSLAATAMEQGRRAVLHAFGNGEKARLPALPTGIYTIPEISMIGATEKELTEAKVPYEVGAASYKELSRGQIAGNTTGRLKMLFHRETLKLLGVHIIGDHATDLIHIGQMVMAFEGTIEYFVEHVFNYPTYSESYRVAALNGLNRL